MKKIFSMLLFGFLSLSVSSQTAVSVAGFFPLPEQVSRGSGRTVYNFNLGWRFHRGDVAGAEAAVFDDLQWEVVSIPHSVQLMPSEASGCRNYQGIAWYRKRFVVPEASEGKDVSIHFEAAMGKQVLYLNGDKVGEHQGGYLPFNLNLTDQGVVAGDTCVVAVMVDNSNDKTFPPGKPQYTLDFSYHGGIYRDVWLISKGRTALTDAVEANRVAGGGVFVHAENISEQHAEVVVKSEVENKENRNRTVTIETVLVDAGQRIVGKKRRKLALKAGEVGTVEQRLAVRNYTLFRYMLGCNAYSKWPTKFNGGLFTFDPVWVNPDMAFTPDFRRWGGGTHTAQNQRLVYWPMLKNGDFDMMLPQFDYYLRILPTAEKRSRIYWNHEGACFAEQIENFGLPNPAEYGFKRPPAFDKGLEYNAWLEYEWDTVLEFCLMILETHRYRGMDIRSYEPLILSSLRFFDEHYRYLARQRGCKELDGNGKLVLFPGSACETYKMTYNASSTVAALHVVLQAAGSYFKENAEALAFVREMQQRIPSIPLHTIGNKIMISPALVWERVNNVETPQLYPVFPWRVYGLGRPNLEIARNTYYYDVDAQKFRTHIGWKQDNIWAACLGLTDEAVALNQRKLYNGPHRFPAFWGPGYDWTPDHNWGGSGMIGLQEMLMQEDAQGNIIRYPAWPKNRKVHFRLHASGGRVVME